MASRTSRATPARLGSTWTITRPACEAPASRARVERDLADGRRYGVTGTPTFFINGRVIRGAQPFAQFKAQLDAALER